MNQIDVFDNNLSMNTKEHFINEKQKQVLIWAQQGLSLKETADKMNVSNKMIENIRTTIFEKFEVKSIEQAIQYASNRRLI